MSSHAASACDWPETPSPTSIPTVGPFVDDTLLLLINAHWEPIGFVLPAHQRRVRWEPLLDTREADGQPRRRPFRGGQTYDLEARSLALFRLGRTPRSSPADPRGAAVDAVQ